MGQHSRRQSMAESSTSRTEVEADKELEWPFGRVDSLDRDDLRETAYEVFFTACRSSPGFGGGRNALTYHPSAAQDSSSGDVAGVVGNGNAGGGGGGTRSIVGTSRIKRALGLKTKRLSPKKILNGSAPGSPHSNSQNLSFSSTVPARPKRPLTSAELMRQQMRVSEQSDNRLRKTLMRTLVGQMGRRAETIILPLELLRQLKPSEFNDIQEYNHWQRRQLKILEAGLLLHPSIPLDRSTNQSAVRLREIIRSSDLRSIDTSKNSETMRSLCSCAVSLAWRGPNGLATDTCHWADGFPMNVHLYLSLLHSIFDLRDETMVVDEIDELMDLMKKTWSTLGINRLIHNVCFTWILFHQFIVTGQSEPDLLCASLAMLAEVSNDTKRADREFIYVKLLSASLASMQGWAEKRLLDYHESFKKAGAGLMENVLPLALSAARILDQDVSTVMVDSTSNRVDYYIRSSLRNAFSKVIENGNVSSMVVEVDEDASDTLVTLANDTEELAIKEKETFSPILKRWHNVSAGVAAVTLHNCYGVVLKQYLVGVSTPTSESVRVLQTAGKLEKLLVHMVVEDSVDCEDGGKAIVREMVPYEVDTTITGLMKTWIDERLKRGRDLLIRAKDTETWNPKSKSEPYAQSAAELIKLAREAVDEFFEIPVGMCEDLVQDLAIGLETLFQDYTCFVASCGNKQSYVPALPPLTRCNQESKLLKLWNKTSPCKTSPDQHNQNNSNDTHQPCPSTSRGTQRLYIRLNTLHYIQSQLHALDKALSISPRPSPSPRNIRFPNSRRRLASVPSYFDLARSSIYSATQHVSEVAAYRLIFLDSNSVFYDTLYVNGNDNARIYPALRTLKQNLMLLSAIVTDRAQPLAIKEVMKASFEAFLMVLLAGGVARTFYRSDYEMIAEDFGSLKRVFATCGEGLVAEEVVEREADVVEGVVGLMAQPTEQLVEDFSIIACEASGLGLGGVGKKVPMPPTTGRWNQADPNTILRVLCHRNDWAANWFLKKNFQLAKRR